MQLQVQQASPVVLGQFEFAVVVVLAVVAELMILTLQLLDEVLEFVVAQFLLRVQYLPLKL